MDHARLHCCLGLCRRDRVGQTLQTVATHYACVEDATVLEFGQHVEPLFRTFTAGRSDPQTQNVTVSVEIDAQRHINRSVRDVALTNFEDNSVNQNDRINRAVSTKGRDCQARMSPNTWSVTFETRSRDTVVS